MQLGSHNCLIALMIYDLIVQINTHTILWKITKPKKLSINGLKLSNKPPKTF